MLILLLGNSRQLGADLPDLLTQFTGAQIVYQLVDDEPEGRMAEVIERAFQEIHWDAAILTTDLKQYADRVIRSSDRVLWLREADEMRKPGKEENDLPGTDTEKLARFLARELQRKLPDLT